jgi:hypothetical protein
MKKKSPFEIPLETSLVVIKASASHLMVVTAPVVYFIEKLKLG